MFISLECFISLITRFCMVPSQTKDTYPCTGTGCGVFKINSVYLKVANCGSLTVNHSSVGVWFPSLTECEAGSRYAAAVYQIKLQHPCVNSRWLLTFKFVIILPSAALPPVRNLWVSSYFPAKNAIHVHWQNPSGPPVSHFYIQWRPEAHPSIGCWITVDGWNSSAVVGGLLTDPRNVFSKALLSTHP